MSKRDNSRGKEAFEAYYCELFGARWTSLREALLGEEKRIPWSNGLLEAYFLDPASVIAALCLYGGKTYLDLCAAPGGKSLVIAGTMEGGAILTANERSAERRRRMLSVFSRHLPGETRARVKITGRDAARWCRTERAAYDRILLDAPCSSERHVMKSPAHLAQWSPARTKNLSAAQWAMLSSAFLALAQGGILVYSTCSLSPRENDDIIERLFAKYGGEAELNRFSKDPVSQAFTATGELPSGEATRYGQIVLPDTSGGSGPLYFAAVRKTPAAAG